MTSPRPAAGAPDAELSVRWQHLAAGLVSLTREATVAARLLRTVEVAAGAARARAAALVVRGPAGASERLVLSVSDLAGVDRVRRRLARHQLVGTADPDASEPADPADLLEVVVPGSEGGVYGHLYALGPQRPTGFDEHDRALLTALAEGTAAGVASTALLEETRARLEVQCRRARLAAARQDDVIQRLFSIGLSLHTTSASVPGGPGERLQQAVADIDETIRQVRACLGGAEAGDRRR